MDNYKTVDVMCPGSFGLSYFVEDRHSGLEYTLKKVECLDEIRANQSLQEALCLIDLDHPHIVRYRELFVSWDKHISSSMFSMVMDCSYGTTLKIVISSQRQQKKTFEEKCLQMFLGQMVNALAYLHNRNILHRNLKPSNILMSGNSVFRICDFATVTITRDRAKVRRIKEIEKCWMAPESIYLFQWSEKSDIWSLGCVLLDMLICHILTEEATLVQLSQLREDLSLLDLITAKDFRKLLARMLRHEPRNRANVWLLANDSLVKQCLILCGSSPHSIKRTFPQAVPEPPFYEGIDNVLEFMMNYTDVETIQDSVLSYLLKEKRMALDRIGDVLEAVTSVMLYHSESACIQLKSFQLIQLLLNAEKACELIVKLGSIRQVLNTIRAYPHEKDIIIPGCKIIECALDKGCSSLESFPDAVETLCFLGEMHLQDAIVAECVCAALQVLINKAQHADIEKATCLLMHALKSHPNVAAIVNHVLLAMTSLIKTSETAALQLLHVTNKRNGVYDIMAARRHHSECPKITENFCMFLKQLVQHGAIISELRAENVNEELEQILQQYEFITEIVLVAQDVLSKMMSLNDPKSTSLA